MVRPNADQAAAEDGRHLAETADEARSNWERTLHDMELMAEDREASGYETLTLPAADTTPKSPDTGDTDEWGLAYIVGSNQLDELEAFDAGLEFDGIAVYQAESAGHKFIVTECTDTAAERVLFVAGTYQLRHAGPLVRTAVDREEMHTHIKHLDGTTVRTVHHPQVEPFFPDPDRLLGYEGRV
jgi:hypothetical protein